MSGFGSIAFRTFPEDKGFWAIFVEDVRMNFCFFSEVCAPFPSDPDLFSDAPKGGARRGVLTGDAPGRPSPPFSLQTPP